MNAGVRCGIALLAAALVAGCATPKLEGEPNEALLPRQPMASQARAPGSVALLVPPEVRTMVYETDKGPAMLVRVHAGRIVAAALSAALNEGLEGGARQVEKLPSAREGFDATLVVDTIRVEYRQALAWLIPVPPFGISETHYYAQLAIDLRLLDAEGKLVRAMSVDSGSVMYQTSWSREPMPQGVVRITHEQAWQAAQKLIADLRPWLASERNKAREL